MIAQAATAETENPVAAKSVAHRVEVLDSAGKQIVLGTVNGEAIELAPGRYTVRLIEAVKLKERQIELGAGEELTIDI